MGVSPDAAPHRVPRLDFELTAGCDHRCAHCYNVWNARAGDPQAGAARRPLPAAEFLAVMEKAITQSGAAHVTLTGGEPLLRRDALDCVALATRLARDVSLVTNGSHVPPPVAARLAGLGLRSVQLTLLAGDRETHDALKGAPCFDDTVRAALDLRDAGVPVQICFVATRPSCPHFEAVLELACALGAKGISYNRMAPAGGAIHHVEALLPTVEQIEANLETAERLAPALGMRVATAMPIPPCLVRLERYPSIRFGFCSTGSHAPNLVIDPSGQVRACNLSSEVLGDLTTQDWAAIYPSIYMKRFRRTVPDVCRGCAYESSCQGGCKESAFATFGDLRHPDPLLHVALAR